MRSIHHRTSYFIVFLLLISARAHAGEGLKLEKVGTEQVYFTHNGKPLLSFGGLSDFIFYGAEDAYNYKLWADWAAEHGINHVRAYPPLSWEYIVQFSQENGGAPQNILFPYEQTSPGSLQFDITKSNKPYWDRFRAKCEYLQSKGIIIHLLMWNGWQLRATDTVDAESAAMNWPGHFFNPANNVNDFTDHLGGDLKNRFAIYHSVADGNEELAEAEKAWFRKLIEMTADFDNVYYDLVHELGGHQGDWNKTQKWIDAMVPEIRSTYEKLQPNKEPIIGMDTGGLTPEQRDWIFTRPYFDLLIYGKAHKMENVRNWRIKYKKPYIPQESWDDDGIKYSYMHPEQHVHIRKYMWKMMMLKCQQMDLYMKPRDNPSFTNLPKYPHNYDPRGRSIFEQEAKILRDFWNRLDDYPNLWFQGRVTIGTGKYKMVLSSSKEAIIYLSSGTGQQDVRYGAGEMEVTDLALEDGIYMARVFLPASGPSSVRSVTVSDGTFSMNLSRIEDDMAILVEKSESGRRR